MMQPAQTAVDQLLDIPVGDQVSVVGEVTAIEGQTLTMEVLQGQDYDRRTGTTLKLERPGNENIVSRDCPPGTYRDSDRLCERLAVEITPYTAREGQEDRHS